ncbi:hypothetical protein NP493_2176g00001 [Ridgeia piscesae]|uniref:Uncharacterized protein n=1 Tax=Ridgeia piscesae TaxID=27915 RepID=A0AAD9JJS0_RIDPI|nr:hypothetical protein NP493_2176g00001 [Ridgeia piscesae]
MPSPPSNNTSLTSDALATASAFTNSRLMVKTTASKTTTLSTTMTNVDALSSISSGACNRMSDVAFWSRSRDTVFTAVSLLSDGRVQLCTDARHGQIVAASSVSIGDPSTRPPHPDVSLPVTSPSC